MGGISATGDPVCRHGLPLAFCARCQWPAPRTDRQPTVGCICPPGANKDCENPLCPRRNPFKGQYHAT